MHKKILLSLMLLLFISGCQTAASDLEAENKEVSDAEEIETQTDINQDDDSAKHQTEIDSGQQNDGTLTVHYIDVGQGDATLFQYTGGNEEYTILYDTGDWLGSEVVPYLQQQGINKLDIVIISHPHADHIGQLKQVMENLIVDEVWMSGNQSNSTVFKEAMESVLNSVANYEEPRAGDQYDVGPLQMTILHPADLTGDLNEDSLSFHLQFKDIAFIFTGDASKKEEHMMMNQDNGVKATVLQLGHHGSSTSSSTDFIKAVQPKMAIYSAGLDNSYGHPHEEVVSLFKKEGIDLYGTDQYGTIIISTDGQTTELITEKTPKEAAVNTNDSKANAENKTPEADSPASGQQTDCIDINAASKDELTTITHIGEVRADAIIASRPFQSVEELLNIPGIGKVRFAEMNEKHHLCIGGESS